MLANRSAGSLAIALRQIASSRGSTSGRNSLDRRRRRGQNLADNHRNPAGKRRPRRQHLEEDHADAYMSVTGPTAAASPLTCSGAI